MDNQNSNYNSGDNNADNYNNGNYNSGDNNTGNYNNGNYNSGEYNQNNNYQYYNNYNNANGGYGQPYPPQYQPQYSQQMELEEPMKISEWVIINLIMMIPCVNIIMMFVWAFSKTEKKSKSNYFKASLIFAGIAFVLYFVLIIVIVAAGLAGGYY